MPTPLRDVRSQGQSGKHLLALSFSGFDPVSDVGIAGHRPTIVLYSHSISPSTGATLSGEQVERRLAAILAADVAGYSRLMAADEVGTLTALKAHRREVVRQ
jgi:hypothetical protein